MNTAVGLRNLIAHPVSLALIAALFNSIWFHEPLLGYLATHLEFPSLSAWSTALIVWLIPTILSATFFSLLALVSNTLLKAGVIVCFVGNSIALYFMQQYSVLLDRTMLGNVFNTNLDESLALIDPLLAGYVAVWGGLPALAVYVWPLRRAAWWHKALGAIAPVVACAGLIYSLSFTWLWIDRHASQIGSRMLPWSYVINSIRFVQQESDNQMKFAPLPDATIDPLQARKRVVVLVIGESARADRFSLLGYERDTNAETRAAGAVAIAGVRACATYTTAALNCILSHRGHEIPTRAKMGEPLPTFLKRQGVEVIWRTANFGHPPIDTHAFDTPATIQKSCPDATCPNGKWDEVLLHGLGDAIEKSSAERIFVVLHLAGSHGPAYHEKYPPEFERFQPVCKTVILKNCDQNQLHNTYDNTIAYTDHVLARLTRLLARLDATSAWMYVSDHGESLGESGLYLHGTPLLFAPREQLEIPFMLWFSPQFSETLSIDPAKASSLTGVEQGHVFHTVMGMLAMRSGPYNDGYDLLNRLR